MQHYLMLSRNFFAEKQYSNIVLPFRTRVSSSYSSASGRGSPEKSGTVNARRRKGSGEGCPLPSYGGPGVSSPENF